jgi:hypothetical protein
METIVGIFHSTATAEQAVDDLLKREMPAQSLILLTRQEPKKYGAEVRHEKELGELPDPGSKATGAGKSGGKVLGATVGGSAGFALAATAAALTIPGLGIVFAVGLGGAALLGLGGAAAAAKAGDSMGDALDTGVPNEDAEFYRRLLQHGYSLVISNVRSGSDISTVREVFLHLGSEDAEQARRDLREAA